MMNELDIVKLAVLKSRNEENSPSHITITIIESLRPTIIIEHRCLTKNKILIKEIENNNFYGHIIRRTKWGVLIHREIAISLRTLSSINTVLSQYATAYIKKNVPIPLIVDPNQNVN